MILLQLSAGQGPDECCIAVQRAMSVLQKECEQHNVSCKLIEQTMPSSGPGLRSVLFMLEGSESAQLAAQWQGSMLWQCTSPIRPRHKRKNWFFNGALFTLPDTASVDTDHREIQFRSCRSSGAGGQHVNTTDSAVQATHLATGIQVRVESERSQHANKRLAIALIHQKLQQAQSQIQQAQNQARHQQHHQLERGNPIRRFSGITFKAC